MNIYVFNKGKRLMKFNELSCYLPRKSCFQWTYIQKNIFNKFSCLKKNITKSLIYLTACQVFIMFYAI